MKSARLMALVYLFCVDVHVRAETVKCWGKKIPCAIEAKQRETVEAKGVTISLAPSAILVQRNEKTIQLVNGDFYVETESPVTFRAPFANVWCEKKCKALFNRTSDQLTVKSLAGSWQIKRRGEKTVYKLDAGLQLLLGEILPDGIANMEFPQSLPWDATVKLWSELYPRDFEDLKPALVKFRAAWREAVESVSDLHRTEAARTIASYEKSQAEERARKAAQEREDAGLRALFKEKNP